jgi:holliday junction DNA helicase RuvA
VIGRLCGTIVQREPDGAIVIDVLGVGYEVFVPQGTLGKLSVNGADGPVTLHIHTHVRDDAITLFGFATADDRVAFRALLKVSSIGPKLALAIIGALDGPALQQAVARQDKGVFKGISGVGSKTVERLLVDLRDKLHFTAATNGKGLRAVPAAPTSTADTVVGALVQMGYKRAAAEAAVGNAGLDQGEASVEKLLRAALTALS